MTEDETKKEEEVSQEETESNEEAEEKVQKIDVKVDTSEISKLKNEVDSIKELIVSKFNELKEKQEVVKVKEMAKETYVDETKGEVSAEENSSGTVNGIVIERAENGKGMSIFADYENYPKLKRLSRN